MACCEHRNDREGFDANWSVEQIQHGWDVHDVNRGYLTASKGFLFPSKRYIPVRDIQVIRQDRGYLGVSKTQLEQKIEDIGTGR